MTSKTLKMIIDAKPIAGARNLSRREPRDV
jgi:hypothetical protein